MGVGRGRGPVLVVEVALVLAHLPVVVEAGGGAHHEGVLAAGVGPVGRNVLKYFRPLAGRPLLSRVELEVALEVEWRG